MLKKFFNTLQYLNNQAVGMNQRNLGLIYPNNARHDYHLADDKISAKNLLANCAVPTPLSYEVIAEMGQLESAWNRLQRYDAFAIKPARGSGGKGIWLLRKKNHVWTKGGLAIAEEDILQHMANILCGIFSFGDSDRVLVEALLEPHDFLTEIFPGSLPDFRLIYLSEEPVMAMLRLPTHKSGGKANLHQGGLGVGIDMQKGLLKEAFNGNHYMDHHPDTGASICGKAIPYWNEMLEVGARTAKNYPLKYLGIDMVLDKSNGPMVMEVNVRPGLAIQLVNRQGLKDAISNLQNANHEIPTI